LEQVGLEPPSADWTFTEFWEYAQSAKQEGIYGFGLGPGAIKMIFDTMNTPWGDESGDVPIYSFNTPEVKQTTKFLLKMQYEGVIPGLGIDIGDKYWTWRQHILSGKTAFWMNITTSYLNEELKYEPGMLPLPGYTQKPSIDGLLTFFISEN